MLLTGETTQAMELEDRVGVHPQARINPSRKELIRDAIERREAFVAANGALATWTAPRSTGRSPRDTYIVRHRASERSIDWDSPSCIELCPETFDMLWDDALVVLKGKNRLYVTDRSAGADPTYALPIRTVTDRALHALFTDNMFRPVPEDLQLSSFADQPFSLIVLPHDKVDTSRYEGRLRRREDGRTSDIVIAMDFDRRLGLVLGSSYCGSVKKLIFTVMSHLLPEIGILPLHCSANQGADGATGLLLGLSGTGKTSLSSDPRRILLGDDEHGWSDNGIANFENGCYSKLINLRPDRETEIFEAVFHHADPLEHVAIVENCLIYPDGRFDLDDTRLTTNSRACYPLSALANIKMPPLGDHPKTILFLAADANGVLPPVARLDTEQAMLWFLMGYTSKLVPAGSGVVEPVSTFSRFFGAPFMPRNPDAYASLLGEKLARHGTSVYLVNTGWIGGPHGEGVRVDIALTRALVDAALSGRLENVPYLADPRFHFNVPRECPDVPPDLLLPRNTWKDPAAYDRRAHKLAGEFAAHFRLAYGDKSLDPEVVKQCPGDPSPRRS